VLADVPSKRHMCPVTLFLALAIADGVIRGVRSPADLESVADCDETGWVMLPYQSNSMHMSIIRRVGNQSRLISSCMLKPAALEKMMHAQVERAGHKKAYSTIVHDNQKAALREKRRKA
jgi:hypothetical protein